MTGWAERPVVFGRARHLAGIECRPTDSRESADHPVAIFINAGIVHRVGPHRIYVRLARALAEVGVPSLRFDLSGLGASRVPDEGVGSRDASVRADLDDALDHAAVRFPGGRPVPVGLCSGGDRAFETALRRSEVVGAVLIDPDVHVTRGHRMHELRSALGRGSAWRSLLSGRYLRSALARIGEESGDAERPVPSREGLSVTVLPGRADREREMRSLLERPTSLHYLFTAGLLERFNHRAQFFEAYPAVADHRRLELTWFPDADHTFSGERAQRELVAAVQSWFARTFDPSPHP